MSEPIVVLMILFLGIFAAGHLIGYHQGWQEGYWTEHPGDSRDTGEDQ